MADERKSIIVDLEHVWLRCEDHRIVYRVTGFLERGPQTEWYNRNDPGLLRHSGQNSGVTWKMFMGSYRATADEVNRVKEGKSLEPL